MRRKTLLYWILLIFYAGSITGTTYYLYSGQLPVPLLVSLKKIDEQIHAPTTTYRLTSFACVEGRRGECQQLIKEVSTDTGTMTTVIDATLTHRYEAAGGYGRALALLSVAPAADRFYFEEIFSSSQPRQIFRLEGASGTLSVLPWKHNPFAGDRVSPDGRYAARVADDFSVVEIFDLFTTVSSTPLRLFGSTETLAATACGFAGKSPNLTWRTDSVLAVEVFTREPEGARSCAGPFLRTVTLVVE
jgi:hypothetical protein